MNAFETTLGSLIAAISALVAVYYAWRQSLTLRSLRYDTTLRPEQRRYLLKQSYRRLCGSFLLMLLAGLLAGSLLLDYTPMQVNAENEPEAKDALRLLSCYWMNILMVLLLIMALAVFDLWAVARYGVQQRKRLTQEHQDALAEELARLRRNRAEMN